MKRFKLKHCFGLRKKSCCGYTVEYWLLDKDGSIFCKAYGSKRKNDLTDERFVRIRFHHRNAKTNAWYGWNSDRNREIMHPCFKRTTFQKPMRAGWRYLEEYVGTTREIRGEPLGILRNSRVNRVIQAKR